MMLTETQKGLYSRYSLIGRTLPPSVLRVIVPLMLRLFENLSLHFAAKCKHIDVVAGETFTFQSWGLSKQFERKKKRKKGGEGTEEWRKARAKWQPDETQIYRQRKLLPVMQ
jgi:hypothetical protein